MVDLSSMLMGLMGGGGSSGGGGGGGLAGLANALASAQAKSEESNPFRPIASAVAGVKLDPTKMSRKDSLIQGLLQGVGTGLLGGFGNMYQEAQDEKLNRGLGALLSGGAVPEDVGSVFTPVENAYKMFELQNTLGTQAAAAKSKAELENMLALEEARGLASHPEDADAITAAFKRLKNPAAAAAEAEAQSIAARAKEPEAEVEPAVEDNFGLGKTLQDKLNEALDEAASKRLKGGPALDYAQKVNALDVAQNKTAAARVQEAFERATKLEDLANTAEAGVSGAGQTGGAAGGLRDWASAAYALVNPEEAQQRASQKILESIAPDVVKAGRTPGAVSDIEMKTLIGSGPSSSNTPEQNKALIERMKGIAGMERDYASFLEAIQSKYGHTTGAENLWAKYKGANPLYTQKDDGTFEINTKRTPWQQFDFKASTPAPASEVVPLASTSPAVTGANTGDAGKPAVGSTFQGDGKKIISVKRIR